MTQGQNNSHNKAESTHPQNWAKTTWPGPKQPGFSGIDKIRKGFLKYLDYIARYIHVPLAHICL